MVFCARRWWRSQWYGGMSASCAGVYTLWWQDGGKKNNVCHLYVAAGYCSSTQYFPHYSLYHKVCELRRYHEVNVQMLLFWIVRDCLLVDRPNTVGNPAGLIFRIPLKLRLLGFLQNFRFYPGNCAAPFSRIQHHPQSQFVLFMNM
jgi:hypothetical protein